MGVIGEGAVPTAAEHAASDLISGNFAQNVARIQKAIDGEVDRLSAVTDPALGVEVEGLRVRLSELLAENADLAERLAQAQAAAGHGSATPVVDATPVPGDELPPAAATGPAPDPGA